METITRAEIRELLGVSVVTMDRIAGEGRGGMPLRLKIKDKNNNILYSKEAIIRWCDSHDWVIKMKVPCNKFIEIPDVLLNFYNRNFIANRNTTIQDLRA